MIISTLSLLNTFVVFVGNNTIDATNNYFVCPLGLAYGVINY